MQQGPGPEISTGLFPPKDKNVYVNLKNPKLQMEAEEDPGLIQYRRIAWNACPDVERDGFLWPNKQQLATDRHTDGLMRMALQVTGTESPNP